MVKTLYPPQIVTGGVINDSKTRVNKSLNALTIATLSNKLYNR